MPIEPWDGDELAGILMGLEDARRELIDLHKRRQEGDPTKFSAEIAEAADRWYTLASQLDDWPRPSYTNRPNDV